MSRPLIPRGGVHDRDYPNFKSSGGEPSSWFAREHASDPPHIIYIYILFSFFSSTLSSSSPLPPSLWFFVFLLFLSLAARTGFLGTRYKGGVTSDAPRKFISRFNAAALLALIYIHSPKPRTASGARLVSSPDRTPLSTGLSCKSLNT